MFVVVYEFSHPHWIIFGRRIGPREKLDAFKFARIVDGYRNRYINWDLFSFDGRGDLRVEFRRTMDGGPLKESQSFYWKLQPLETHFRTKSENVTGALKPTAR